MAPSGLLTDLYELNMAASYLERGMGGEATFSLFVRQLPPTRGFLVAAGLEPALEFLEGFGLSEEELDYLGRELGFEDPVLDALGALRFRGDVWAVPEGRVVYANEPLLEITAPIAVAIASALQFCADTSVAARTRASAASADTSVKRAVRQPHCTWLSCSSPASRRFSAALSAGIRTWIES